MSILSVWLRIRLVNLLVRAQVVCLALWTVFQVSRLSLVAYTSILSVRVFRYLPSCVRWLPGYMYSYLNYPCGRLESLSDCVQYVRQNVSTVYLVV